MSERTPGFNRFMDAAIGTDWRRRVPDRAVVAILRAWDRGDQFTGMHWEAIRAKVTKMIKAHTQAVIEDQQP